MKNIKVVSKHAFIDILQSNKLNDTNIANTENSNCFFISIINPEDFYLLKDQSNVLNLKFHDVEISNGKILYQKDQLPEYYIKTIKEKFVYFDDKMGLKVINFINKLKNKDFFNLVIHCSAGISRSGAIGAFATEYLNLDYNEFIFYNPQIIPNNDVLSILRKLTKNENV